MKTVTIFVIGDPKPVVERIPTTALNVRDIREAVRHPGLVIEVDHGGGRTTCIHTRAISVVRIEPGTNGNDQEGT